MSICTGAFVLAAAGLLDGVAATTHGPAPTIPPPVPGRRLDESALYVDDGDVLTSAGLSAGLDLCLHVLRRDHGAAVANAVARHASSHAVARGRAGAVHRPPARRVAGAARRRRGPGRWPASTSRSTSRARRPRADERAAPSPAGSAPRPGLTPPTRGCTRQRLDRARHLLETTDLPIDRIAAEARARHRRLVARPLAGSSASSPRLPRTFSTASFPLHAGQPPSQRARGFLASWAPPHRGAARADRRAERRADRRSRPGRRWARCCAATGTRSRSRASWPSSRSSGSSCSASSSPCGAARAGATGSSPRPARTGRRRWPTASSRPTASAARTTAGCSTPTARAPSSPPSGTNTDVPGPGAGPGRHRRGDGRPGLGLRRPPLAEQPAPELPRFDTYVMDGFRDIGWADLPCNYVQIMENAVDPHHVEFLHGRYFEFIGRHEGFTAPAVVRQGAREDRLRRRSSGGSSSAACWRAPPRRTTTGRSATRSSSRTTCASAAAGSTRCRSGCRSTARPPASCSTRCTPRTGYEHVEQPQIPDYELPVFDDRGRPRHQLRRGPGHDGLGDPGADHRPDHRAPGPHRHRRGHAAQDVPRADGRRRRAARTRWA